MRAVAAEAALEQDELADREGLGREAAAPLEEIGDLPRAAAFPPRQSDMRMEGVALGLQADGEAGTLDLGGEGDEGFLRLDAGPQGTAVALFEPADAPDSDVERAGANAGQSVGQVIGQGPLDLTHETQREVQLVVVLPAEVGRVVHRVHKEVADMLGRPDCDEQAVHASRLALGTRRTQPR